MERIVLEVDNSIASAWRGFSTELKQRFTKEIEARLEKQIRLAEKDKFNQALTDMRQQAAENGLTEEILEQLLNEKD